MLFRSGHTPLVRQARISKLFFALSVFKIACNVRSFALPDKPEQFVLIPDSYRDRDSSAEQLLSKVNEDDIIFCCSALFVKPGLQMISERDDKDIFVSQHSAKPHPMFVIEYI